MKKYHRERRRHTVVKDRDGSRAASPLSEAFNFWTKHRYFAHFVLLLLSVGPFLPSLNGDFVFDDAETIVNNPIVNGKESLWNIFTRDFWGRPISSDASHKSYRPVTTLTFWMNFALHGYQTTGYHIVNLALHGLCTLAVYGVIKILPWSSSCPSDLTAFFIAIIFAIHPVHTEAVANITGRAELLMSLFLLLSLKFYISKDYLKMFIFATLSIFSKEQGIMIFPIFMMVDILRKDFSFQRCAVLLFTALDFALIRLALNGFRTAKFTSLDNPAAFVGDPIFRWLNIGYLWFYHLSLLVLPYPLCFDYSMGCIQLINSYSDPRLGLLLLLPVVIIVGYYAARNLADSDQRSTLFGIIFGAFAMFPASNIAFTVGFTVAERVLYLPSIGYCLLLAIAYKYLSKIYKSLEIVSLVIMAMAVSHCFARSKEWTNELSLYSSGLEVCPNNAKIHYNLGKVLNDLGNEAEAERNYWNAIHLHPTYDQALNNLGNLLERNGRRDQAEQLLKRALQAKPHFAGAWMNLGISQMNSEKFDEAEASFDRSLRLRPNSADCHFNLGNLYQRTNRLHKAMNAWRNATRIDPTHTKSWINLLVVLDELDDCQSAISLSDSVLTHLPHEPTILFQLGSCFGQLGHYEMAEQLLREAISISPENSLYHTNLGVLYERWHRYSDAEVSYRRAALLESSDQKTISTATENLQALTQKRDFRKNSTRHH